MAQPIRLLILGGSGYVGQNVLSHAALAKPGAYKVQSFSRSGEPPKSHITPNLLDSKGLEGVEWLTGDIFDEKRRNEVMSNADVVISTIGAFGSNEFMEHVCGDAAILACKSAKENGVKQFNFISSAQVGSLTLPKSVPMYGYYNGKSRAEECIQETFPDNHTILRPGFIYGDRVGPKDVVLPLKYVGIPGTFVGTKLGVVSKALQMLPFVGMEVKSMVDVADVARWAVMEGKGVVSAEEIRK